MEIGELIAMGILEEEDIECPFHEEKHKCDDKQKNKLEGNSAMLGRKLASERLLHSTVMRRKKEDNCDQYKKVVEIADPDKNDPCKRHVEIQINNSLQKYPVGYAAHHLIPADASLNKAEKLLPYIDKAKGKICCNLGYNVNGNENGVWLPGLHPVNANGLNVWNRLEIQLPDKENKKKAIHHCKDMIYLPITVDARGEYIKKAMEFLSPKRQFHDAHPEYSKLVEEHLNNIGNLLTRISQKRKFYDEPLCLKCKERQENHQENEPYKLLPPFKLFKILNRSSEYFRKQLVEQTKHKTYFTSSWCYEGNRELKK